MLEGVQQTATKLVHGTADLKYDDRLKRLGLVRLENRRLRSDLIETYKIKITVLTKSCFLMLMIWA